jgi:hypothetical protein
MVAHNRRILFTTKGVAEDIGPKTAGLLGSCDVAQITAL